MQRVDPLGYNYRYCLQTHRIAVLQGAARPVRCKLQLLFGIGRGTQHSARRLVLRHVSASHA